MTDTPLRLGARLQEAGPRHPDAGRRGRAAHGAQPEVVFVEDPNLFDGRFANNSWLQEAPTPSPRSPGTTRSR
ncbi:MAG: hypothetical protein R3F43_23985 [bacterium]